MAWLISFFFLRVFLEVLFLCFFFLETTFENSIFFFKTVFKTKKWEGIKQALCASLHYAWCFPHVKRSDQP